MRFKVVGTKRDIMAVVIKNDDTIPIKAGGPCLLSLDGTDDGLAAKAATNQAATLYGTFFGFALSEIAVGAIGEAQVFGVNDGIRLRLRTRAASTDTWASYAAGAIGDAMTIVTGTGTVSTGADQAFANAGSAAFSVYNRVRLAESYASGATGASTYLAGETAEVTTKKALILAM